MRSLPRWILISCLSLTLNLATFLPSRAQQPELTRTGARKTLVVKAIERTKGAAINLKTERPRADNGPVPGFGPVVPMANQPGVIQGMGTGIVIDSRGWIVTNMHVIDEVTNLACRLENGASYKAEVLARDPALDLAIIKITPKEPLPTMPLGTASDLMLGETVIAIGNAFGYEHTVSVGVVSAVKRDVNLNARTSYKSLIQTDAAINPGNSGGPLINIHGELIGVNVAIRDKAQNIGFAIPVEHMIRSVRDMLHARRSTYDGIAAADRLKDGPDGPVRSVVVEKIDGGSPAGKAGLKTGDVLVKMNELPIACSYDVERAMLERKSGDKMAVVVLREGKEQRVELVVADRTPRSAEPPKTKFEPELKGEPEFRVDPEPKIEPRPKVEAPEARIEALIRSKLGVRVAVADRDRIKRNEQLKGGLEVTEVDKTGVAFEAGIRKGDILVGLHHWETISLDNVNFVLTHPELRSFSPLTFHIIRAGQVRKGKLELFPETPEKSGGAEAPVIPPQN